MRISDWSSDVCSSDLPHRGLGMTQDARIRLRGVEHDALRQPDVAVIGDGHAHPHPHLAARIAPVLDRLRPQQFVGDQMLLAVAGDDADRPYPDLRAPTDIRSAALRLGKAGVST